MKNILVCLDADEIALPFDILLAYDIYDAVLPYTAVTKEKAARIARDALFARGEKGVKHVVLFVSGSNLQTCEEIYQEVKKQMFPPFVISIIIDPRGAYTTSSAIISRINQLLKKKKIGSLKNKKVTILAGTGPIGVATALSLSELGCKVVITSRDEQKAKNIADMIEDKTGKKVAGLKAADDEEIYSACKDSDIVIATGAPKTTLLKKEVIEKLNASVIADVSTVPPFGVEFSGLRNSVGINGFRIGALKNKIEKKILESAIKKTAYFDRKEILKIALSYV